MICDRIKPIEIIVCAGRSTFSRTSRPIYAQTSRRVEDKGCESVGSPFRQNPWDSKCHI